jgi:hypothetical protein
MAESEGFEQRCSQLRPLSQLFQSRFALRQAHLIPDDLDSMRCHNHAPKIANTYKPQPKVRMVAW